jgi:hypothetical protein
MAEAERAGQAPSQNKMIDLKILEAFGTTDARLKEIFTTVPDDEADRPRKGESKEEKTKRLERSRRSKRDLDIRNKFEKKLMSRIEEGIINSLKHWRMYAAVDLAFDSSVINKATIPLLMFAQGKINVERCAQVLSECSNGEQYLKRDDNKKVIGVDIPKFVETEVNLLRSIILRRHAAQKNKFNNLWPFYKYEARSTGLAAKLRADVLSQRMDMMTDQFDYRHHDAQCGLDALLYGHSLDFPACAWMVEKQYERKSFDGDPKDVNEIIIKEGVPWFNPHPSRKFWDNAFPLCSINTDTGCQFIGFWDVPRFSEIDDNPAYFNKSVIGWSRKFWGDGGINQTYADYFTNYTYTILPPQTGTIDPSKPNDRKSLVGWYSGSHRDCSVFVTNYFERIVPKDFGCGDYPHPVWVRFVVAGDNTVIFAQLYPSTPAAYLGINERDSRQVNISMAMDLLTYNQHMSNLVTRLMMLCQIESFKAIGINIDALGEEGASRDKQLKEIRSALKAENWWASPLVYEFSLAKFQELGVKPDEIIKISEAKTSNSISTIFEAMVKLVQLVERLMALSPNEQGQPAPREISATEVNEIASTTSSIYSSISDDIDEFRAAKKRILYESLICCGVGTVVCPVKDRYTAKTIKEAGFDPMVNEDENFVGSIAKRYTVIGTKRKLIHDYIFTSRDGSERPVNTQAANTLVQLLGQVLAVPSVAQAAGKEKIYNIFNEIFRLSGAGIDLNLELSEGEDNSLGQDEMGQIREVVGNLQQIIQQLAKQVENDSTSLEKQELINRDQEQQLKHVNQLAAQVQKNAEDIQKIFGKHSEIQKRLTESINYKDAPPSIQAQLEVQAGLTPAPLAERVRHNGKETANA